MNDIKEIRYRFSNELQTRMDKLGIKECHISFNCRCRSTAVHEYLAGDCLPNLWTLSLLAEYLNCTVNDLLDLGTVCDVRNLEDICAFDTFKDEDSFAVHVRDRILARMKELNMNREELARLTGFSLKSIERWLWLYPHLPQVMKFLEISAVLDCTPSDLLGY